jgi:hypothetical protein
MAYPNLVPDNRINTDLAAHNAHRNCPLCVEELKSLTDRQLIHHKEEIESLWKRLQTLPGVPWSSGSGSR